MPIYTYAYVHIYIYIAGGVTDETDLEETRELRFRKRRKALPVFSKSLAHSPFLLFQSNFSQYVLLPVSSFLTGYSKSIFTHQQSLTQSYPKIYHFLVFFSPFISHPSFRFTRRSNGDYFSPFFILFPWL